MNTETPKGKRTVRTTVRGTVNGYIGKVLWECLGERSDPETEVRVQEFLAAEER